MLPENKKKVNIISYYTSLFLGKYKKIKIEEEQTINDVLSKYKMGSLESFCNKGP